MLCMSVVMFLKPLVLISDRRTLVPGVLMAYKSFSGWIKTADDATEHLGLRRGA